MGPGVDGDQGLKKSSPARAAPAAALIAAGGAARLARHRVPGLARGPVRRGVLAPRLVQRRGGASGFSFQNFQTLWEGDVYRTIAAADDRDRRRGDGHRRGDRVPDRVLHGQGRDAADAQPAARRGADAAVVELPREGLRVAHDPRRGRDPQLGARAVRAQGPRASATSPPGSSSPTCGCRT